MAAGVTIYALCDPDTLAVRYVGKARNLAERLRSHQWEAKSNKFQTHKARWLRSLGERDPLVKVLAESDDESWPEVERFWISEMRNRGCDLTNFTSGGEGWPAGEGHSDETKAILRESALRRGCRPPSRKGSTASDATREKLSAAAVARGATPPLIGGWNKGSHKSHCRNGHEFSSDNTYMLTRRGREPYQVCKVCAADQRKTYHARRA